MAPCCHGTPAPVAPSASLLPATRTAAADSAARRPTCPPFYDGEVGAALRPCRLGRARPLRMMGSGTMDAMAIAARQCDVLFQHSVPDWDRLPGAAIIRGVGGESRVVRVRRGRLARVRRPDRGRRGLRPRSTVPRCLSRLACSRHDGPVQAASGRASCSRPSSTCSSGSGISPDVVTLVGTARRRAGALVFFPQGMLLAGRAGHHRVRLQRPDRRRDGPQDRAARDTFGAFLDSTLDRIARRRDLRRPGALLRLARPTSRLYLVPVPRAAW